MYFPFAAVKQGHVQIVFMCPESMEGTPETSYWKSIISGKQFSKNIGLICFDEVHLLQNWLVLHSENTYL